MMIAIASVCEAFSLKVSETKTEIICLRTRALPDAATIFSVKATDQVYKRAHDLVYLRGNIYHDAAYI